MIQRVLTLLRFSAACAAGFLAGGCVSTGVYPDYWPEQLKAEADACPVIDGAYENAGEEFFKSGDATVERVTRSLAHLLNGGYGHLVSPVDDRLGPSHWNPAEDPHRTIRLQLVEDKLRIEATLTDGSTKVLELPTRRRCRDSTLLLETFWDQMDEITIGRGSHALGRAADGSLLVRRTSTGVIFVFGPNGVYRETDWIRFPPAAQASAQSAVRLQ